MRAAKRIQINVALESVDTLTWVKNPYVRGVCIENDEIADLSFEIGDLKQIILTL